MISLAAFELLTLLWVARSFDASTAGVFYACVGAFSVVTVVVQLGTNVGLVKMVAEARVHGSRADAVVLVWLAMVPCLAVAAIVSATVVLFARDIAEALGGGSASPGETVVLALAAGLPLAVAFQVILAATRGFAAMVPTALFERMAWPASRLGLVIAIAFTDRDPGLLGLAWIAPLPVMLVAAYMKLRQLLMTLDGDSALVRRRSWRTLARQLWAFSGVRAIAATMQMAAARMGVPLVAAVGSPVAAAMYAALARIAQVGMIPLGGVGQAVEPAASQYYAQGRRNQVQAVYQATTVWGLMLALPFYVGVCLYPAETLSMFGGEYEQAADALRVAVAGFLFNVALGPISRILLMAGYARLNLWNAAAGVLTYVPAMFLLIPPLGIEGAALALAVTQVVTNALPLAQMRVMERLQPFSPAFMIVLALGVGTLGGIGGVIPYAFLDNNWERLAVYCFAAVPTFTLLCVAMFKYRIAGLWVPDSRTTREAQTATGS